MAQATDISIHSLRGEGDFSYGCLEDHRRHFNPLPPWGGRRSLVLCRVVDVVFQSTPSVGRETENLSARSEKFSISIHSLRGEGDL